MRLIDSDKLTDKVIHDMAVGALHSRTEWFSLINDIVVAFKQMIDDAPTVDAVPREQYESLLETANELDEALKWYQEEEELRNEML